MAYCLNVQVQFTEGFTNSTDIVTILSKMNSFASFVVFRATLLTQPANVFKEVYWVFFLLLYSFRILITEFVFKFSEKCIRLI